MLIVRGLVVKIFFQKNETDCPITNVLASMGLYRLLEIGFELKKIKLPLPKVDVSASWDLYTY